MKYFKAAIDVAMMVMLVALMAYTLTGNAVHEYMGIALFVLVVIHCVLNRAWYRVLPKMIKRTKGKPKQQLWILCNIVLTLSAIVCLVTSVAISTDAFAFLGIPYLGSTWAFVHTVSAFTMLVSGAIHFGFHGAFFKSLFRGNNIVHYRAPRHRHRGRVSQPIMVVLSVLIALSGVGMYESKLFLAPAVIREQAAENPATVSPEASEPSASNAPQAAGEDGCAPAAEANEAAALSEEDDPQAAAGEQVSPGEQAEEQGDPLDGQICTLCKKCCPLTAPMCGRGVQLAQQILAEQA